LKRRPRRFAGLCFSSVWSTSTIANLDFGKFVATVSIASASVKPTPMVRS